MDWIMERDRVQVLDEAWNVLAEVTFPVVEPGAGRVLPASSWAAPWQASPRAATTHVPRAPMPSAGLRSTRSTPRFSRDSKEVCPLLNHFALGFVVPARGFSPGRAAGPTSSWATYGSSR